MPNLSQGKRNMVIITKAKHRLTLPPGYALFYMKSTVQTEIKLIDIYCSIILFVLFQLLSLGLLWIFPHSATRLPSVIIN